MSGEDNFGIMIVDLLAVTHTQRSKLLCKLYLSVLKIKVVCFSIKFMDDIVWQGSLDH